MHWLVVALAHQQIRMADVAMKTKQKNDVIARGDIINDQLIFNPAPALTLSVSYWLVQLVLYWRGLCCCCPVDTSLQETVPASCIWEHRTSCKPPQFCWEEGLHGSLTASCRRHFHPPCPRSCTCSKKSEHIGNLHYYEHCWVYL